MTHLPTVACFVGSPRPDGGASSALRTESRHRTERPVSRVHAASWRRPFDPDARVSTGLVGGVVGIVHNRFVTSHAAPAQPPTHHGFTLVIGTGDFRSSDMISLLIVGPVLFAIAILELQRWTA